MELHSINLYPLILKHPHQFTSTAIYANLKSDLLYKIMIIFLYGQDTFRSRQKLKELKNKFIKEFDVNQHSLTALDGKTVSLAKINEKISSSLFAKKRMVVIEDIFLNKDKTILENIYNYFNKKQTPDTIIIFWDSSIKTKKMGYKIVPLSCSSSNKETVLAKKPVLLFNFLSSQKYTQEFKSLSNTHASAWVKKQVEERSGSITYSAIQKLIGFTGNNLWRINNEINKLINYKKTAPSQVPALTIKVSDVEQLVKSEFDENIFAFTDALSNKNKTLAINLLEEQYKASLTGSYLMAMIVRQFKILLQIRQALDCGFSSRKIINITKLHPFVVQKGTNQARFFTLNNLKNIFSQLVEIDFLTKTGQADTKMSLNMFIYSL